MSDIVTLPAFKIWKAGVDAVRAESLVARELRIGEAGELEVCGQTYSLTEVRNLCVVGAGKAAGYFAKSIENLLLPFASELNLFGHVNVPANCVVPTRHINLHPGRPAGVNEPRVEGVEGARTIMGLVSSLNEEDLCLCLITGGGSALLPLPSEGVTLEEKLKVTKLMSSRGASIQELNRVRIALSAIKGGGLARACTANRLVTLVVSDVIGDPLDLIASGPTVEPTPGESSALAILANYVDRNELPEKLWSYLEVKASEDQKNSSATSGNTSSRKRDHHLLANNAYAVNAAAEFARDLGYVVHTLPPESPNTTAEQVADQLIERLRALDNAQRHCVVWGGEPTVRLADADIVGRGGRNQQLVLKALASWNQMEASTASRACILSGGTDGEDGPTDAAGAFVNQRIVDEVASGSRDPNDHLARNDAYPLLESVHGLIKTGPTHTNVCDLRIATLG